MAFLSLPRELRNMVYAHFTALSVPLSESQSLQLSCHQIRTEVLQERNSTLHNYLRSLQRRTPHIHMKLSIPQSSKFSARPNLHLSLSTKIFTDFPPQDSESVREMVRAETVILEHIFELDFNSITITFHEDENVPFGIDNVGWIHHNIVHGLLHDTMSVRARRVVVQRPSTDPVCARLLSAMGRAELRGWNGIGASRWILKDTEDEGVVIERRKRKGSMGDGGRMRD